MMEEMRAVGMPPNEMTWTTLLKGYVGRSDLAGARAVIEEMRAAGVQPSKFTWNILLDCHTKCPGDTLSSAEQVALQMESDGLVLDPYAYSALIRCCFPGRAAAHPHNPSQAKQWFSLYVSGWRNRGPLDPIVVGSFERAVGYEIYADVCKRLGLDPAGLLSAGRRNKAPGADGRIKKPERGVSRAKAGGRRI